MSEGVTGLGGVFFRARDPDGLRAWYEDMLGVPKEELMRSDGLVFALRPMPSCSWVSASTSAPAARSRSKIDSSESTRFGWATDPEGNRFELWEPAEGT